MSWSVPSLIQLPRDNGRHPDAAHDGWYIVSDLQGGGRRLGAQAFVLVGGSSVRVSTIVRDLETDQSEGQAMVISLAETTIGTDRLYVRTPISCLTGSIDSEINFELQLSDSSSVQLVLQPTRPVLHNAGSGCFPLFGARTYQFSLGAMRASGTLTFQGQALRVSGEAWYDRQWLRGVPTMRPRFDWMGLCLSNGETLSLWDTTAGDPSGNAWVTAVQADGSHTIAAISPLAGVANDPRKGDLGADYPSRWTVKIPAVGATLEVTQKRLRNLEAGSYTGLANVEGMYKGGPVTGTGFVDLIG